MGEISGVAEPWIQPCLVHAPEKKKTGVKRLETARREGKGGEVNLDVFLILSFCKALFLAWLVYTEGSREVSDVGVQGKSPPGTGEAGSPCPG